jgi:hypothetical protein
MTVKQLRGALLPEYDDFPVVIKVAVMAGNPQVIDAIGVSIMKLLVDDSDAFVIVPKMAEVRKIEIGNN